MGLLRCASTRTKNTSRPTRRLNRFAKAPTFQPCPKSTALPVSSGIRGVLKGNVEADSHCNSVWRGASAAGVDDVLKIGLQGKPVVQIGKVSDFQDVLAVRRHGQAIRQKKFVAQFFKTKCQAKNIIRATRKQTRIIDAGVKIKIYRIPVIGCVADPTECAEPLERILRATRCAIELLVNDSVHAIVAVMDSAA